MAGPGPRARGGEASGLVSQAATISPRGAFVLGGITMSAKRVTGADLKERFDREVQKEVRRQRLNEPRRYYFWTPLWITFISAAILVGGSTYAVVAWWPTEAKRIVGDWELESAEVVFSDAGLLVLRATPMNLPRGALKGNKLKLAPPTITGQMTLTRRGAVQQVLRFEAGPAVKVAGHYTLTAQDKKLELNTDTAGVFLFPMATVRTNIADYELRDSRLITCSNMGDFIETDTWRRKSDKN